jgi:uncharacterized protein YcbX
MSKLFVAGLWRYPVKSLAGEPLQMAEITAHGVTGDRLAHVRGPEGVRTSRRQYRLLGLAGSLDAKGNPRVDGFPWDSEEARDRVRAAAGADAWLEASEPTDDGPQRFDILPLLVATDGAVAAFGRDVRRLRPNILIGGVEGMEERTWEGAELRIRGQASSSDRESDVRIRLDSLRGRCPMTTVDPDTLARDPEVLYDIGRRFGGRLALNAEVLQGGVVEVGAAVELLR